MRRLLLSAKLFTVLLLAGCSVGMALSGDHNPDLSAIKVGATRGEVELHLGAPVGTSVLVDGRQAATYEFELGNEPSAGRAIGHGAMDLVTFGLWEAIGTPIEAVQGDKRRVEITYGRDGRVAAIHHYK